MMKARYFALIALAFLLTSLTVTAKSDFQKEFDENYSLVDQDLYKYVGEAAEVKDFVYRKDLATITFKEGTIYLLRYIDERPTTALFIGQGHASIDIPAHIERRALLGCSGDSVVDENFTVCTIHLGDDFDLKLRDAFTFEEHKIDWREYNAYKQSQGEFFFRPIVDHEYDNFFQLLRSVYERGPDGYFWIDFNRYVYTYDPNRAEQVILAYEHEGGDMVATDCVILQKQERNRYADTELSDIAYPTTIVNRQGDFEVGGLDGGQLLYAAADVHMAIDADSLRFISMFLNYNLDVDSVLYNGGQADFKRRHDFTFLGVILPEYRYRGDTVTIRLFYHGKDYTVAMPFVKNPAPSPHTFNFTAPKGFNFLMPGMQEPTPLDNRRIQFKVDVQQPFRHFYFQGIPTGFDTTSEISAIGITLNFLQSHEYRKGRKDCLIPNETFQPTVKEAFDFLAGRLGPPAGAFEMWVYPESTMTMPGLIEAKQVFCYQEGTGDRHAMAGYQVARQWFGSAMRPVSDREVWLFAALPDYMSLMYTQAAMGSQAFYSHLLLRRNVILVDRSKNNEAPLGAGLRCSPTQRTARGAWLMHMLRFLMFDLDKKSDLAYLKFVNEFAMRCNGDKFSNADFIALAEKYYGQPLDWFFHQWLCDYDIPKYKVEWESVKKDDGYYVSADVDVSKVAPDFTMPIIVHVIGNDESSSFHRPTISGTKDHFELGPFAMEPKELKFNEFYGVLSEDKVDKK